MIISICICICVYVYIYIYIYIYKCNPSAPACRAAFHAGIWEFGVCHWPYNNTIIGIIYVCMCIIT